MLFSSMLFLWIFLPLVLITNGLLSIIPIGNNSLRTRLKNSFLLIYSLIFYAWGGVYYLLIMISVILVNYFAGNIIGRNTDKRKVLLAIDVIINIGVLFYFKYFNLLISTIERLGRMERGALHFKEVVLPIGISFFIFQAMSYVIDVYFNKVSPQKNLFDFALYVSLFPQLIAGPIVQYKDISEQLLNRNENEDKFSDGIKRFIYGLAKKVLIANTLATVVDGAWDLELEKIGPGIAWFAAICYMFQIYYDFSGYSDMAIGIGKMLGFEFKENFNYPYTSLSIKEFWRRWHISLSSWFRDYVYIPLGGSRTSLIRNCFNLFIVFLLTGMWHGSNYTFFVWGMYYAVFIIAEKLFLGKMLDNCRIKAINYIYTLLVVLVGWIFFRADTLIDALVFMGGLFRTGTKAYSVFQFLSFKVLTAFLAAVICSGFLQRKLADRIKAIDHTIAFQIATSLWQLILLALSVMSLVSGTYNPFIYFRF